MLGMTLLTKPEEMYRALIEATAYGTRVIVDAFNSHGVPVKEIIATGGLPDKNRLLMQIYSDVTGMEVRVAAAKQTPALGSAMFAAVAAGAAAGGYNSIMDATHYMARLRAEVYRPNPAAHPVYNRLFAEYMLLHDYFGRGPNDVMKRLKSLKMEVLSDKGI
jgi:L-ribulokinase